MPGGQIVYPTPNAPQTYVTVSQSQSSQRLSGPQSKRGTQSFLILSFLLLVS